ncbi:MAG: hypothetical protein DWQ07_12900 [Chloroflexi bacterium]|nr:MAG: hypothetical protein DWQ07_12900 [Chloroflexota bacterium]MBL1196938.1 hypothetical protein [Chloroflexota bacterium]NOH14234.1 hypothetical protein [Chloroflexota bacterium]
MPDFEKAPDHVETMATQIIEEYHEHLIGRNIGYYFRDKAASSGGRIVLGRARKVTGWAHLYTNLDFVIELAQDEWDDMSEERREALLDHELEHCKIEEGVPKIRPHDIEEFTAIIERRGIWTHDLRRTNEALQNADQMELPFDASKEDPDQLVLPLEEGEEEPEAVPA